MLFHVRTDAMSSDEIFVAIELIVINGKLEISLSLWEDTVGDAVRQNLKGYRFH